MLDIIYEDASLLVVNKPAGLVCHPTKGGELSSLISRVRLYLGGEGRLVNRLDRETSGVTLAAKNSAAAGELGKLWERRGVEKVYLAIVHGAVRDDSGAVDLALGKDEKSRIAIKDCVRPDGAAARTEFFVERRFRRGGRDFSLLRLRPRTGRKHQIRVQAAHAGLPLIGDRTYNPAWRAQDPSHPLLDFPRQALHAEVLSLEHPEQPGVRMSWTAELPKDLRQLETALRLGRSL